MDFDLWIVSDLKDYLYQHDITLKDIRGSGQNGNVIKKDLIRAAKKITKIKTQKPAEFPITLSDVIPTIVKNLNITTQRSLNQYYHQQYPIRDILYEFIIKNYKYNDIEDIKNYFDTYDNFKKYQKEKLNQMDDNMIKFLTYYMYLINTKKFDQMDKNSMNPYRTIAFALHKDNILIFTDFTENEIVPIQYVKVEKVKGFKRHIYSFIYTHFDEYDLYRLSNYYYEERDLKTPKFEEFMNYQLSQVSNIDEEMTKFLNIYIQLINQQKLYFSDLYSTQTFDVDGFIFLNDRLVAFNER